MRGGTGPRRRGGPGPARSLGNRPPGPPPATPRRGTRSRRGTRLRKGATRNVTAVPMGCGVARRRERGLVGRVRLLTVPGAHPRPGSVASSPPRQVLRGHLPPLRLLQRPSRPDDPPPRAAGRNEGLRQGPAGADGWEATGGGGRAWHAFKGAPSTRSGPPRGGALSPRRQALGGPGRGSRPGRWGRPARGGASRRGRGPGAPPPESSP